MTRIVQHDSDMHQAVDRETAGGRSTTEWTARMGSGRTPFRTPPPALGRTARNRLAPLWLAAFMGAVFFLVPPTVPQAQAQADIELWSATLTVEAWGTRSVGCENSRRCRTGNALTDPTIGLTNPPATYTITKIDLQPAFGGAIGTLDIEFSSGDVSRFSGSTLLCR